MMTARERMREAFAACVHVPVGICRDCCVAAILAHAEAVREEAAKKCERHPCHGLIVDSWGYEESHPCDCNNGRAAAIRAMKLE